MIFPEILNSRGVYDTHNQYIHVHMIFKSKYPQIVLFQVPDAEIRCFYLIGWT